MFLGVCGLLFALFVGSSVKDGGGVTAVIVGISLLFLLGGYGAIKPTNQLTNAQADWDRRWLCARCGHQWLQ